MVTPYRPGEGATFSGGAGRLPMRIERAVRMPDGSWTLETTGARYFLDAKGGAIAGAQKLGTARKLAYWRPSLPLTRLGLKRQTGGDVVLASEFLTVGLQADGLLILVPHRTLSLKLSMAIRGGPVGRVSEGRVLHGDDRGGVVTLSDTPLSPSRPPRFELLTPRQEITAPRSGWSARWRAEPGERLALGIFPVRPPAPGVPENAEILEGDDATSERMEALRVEGKTPLAVINAETLTERSAWVRALRLSKTSLRADGVVLRGLEGLGWLAAYERVRLARVVFDSGLVLLPSPAEDTFPLPFIDAYVNGKLSG